MPDTYWTRDERFDLAISLNRGQPALAALCRVLQRWIAHFLAVDVAIAPEREIVDARWVWHVGLDAEASALLNDLYNGVDVADDRRERLLCLFALAILRSGGDASGDRRAAGILGDGDGSRKPPAVEATEPVVEPAAGAAAMRKKAR